MLLQAALRSILMPFTLSVTSMLPRVAREYGHHWCARSILGRVHAVDLRRIEVERGGRVGARRA